jgi:hypothetical protein
MVRLSALRAYCPLLPRRLLVLISIEGRAATQGHSAAGRFMTSEKSSDLIGNQTHNIPACSIVPQLTTLYRMPNGWYKIKVYT